MADEAYDYTYDAEGNRKTKTDRATGEHTEYTWDHRNRLTSVTIRAANQTVLSQIDYGYDVFDRRISRASNNAALETFVYDGDDVLLDLSGTSGTPARVYLHGPAVDQVLAQENLGTATSSANRVLWQLTDNIGSVRALANKNGALATVNGSTATFSYDEFGAPTTATVSIAASLGTRYLYTSREYDFVTHEQYNRARYYDPQAKRWLSEDPIWDDKVNTYRYVGNGPLDVRDPSGLLGWSETIQEGNPFRLSNSEVNALGVSPGDFGTRGVHRVPLYYDHSFLDRTTTSFIGNDYPELDYVERQGADGSRYRATRSQIDDEIRRWGTTNDWGDWFRKNGAQGPYNGSTNANLGIQNGLLDRDDISDFQRSATDLAKTSVYNTATAPLSAIPRGIKFAKPCPTHGLPAKAPSNLRQACFVAGTPVLTDRGQCPIERLEADTLVWAYDHSDGTWKLRRVVAPLKHEYDGDIVTIVTEGDRIQATGNHPFWVVLGDGLADRPTVEDVYPDERGLTPDGRWVESRHLRVGDVLLSRHDRTVRVESLSSERSATRVYNIEVEGLHTYAVGELGLLVHNKPMTTTLQTGGNTIDKSTAEALGLTRSQANRAMHALKRANTIPNNYHQTKILSNGDVVDSNTGQVIDNLHLY